jgi:hypothetical protein
VLFNYGDIQWTSDAAFIGFSAGDSTFSYILPESLSDSTLLNLENSSNVGRPGQYIFRVDQRRVNETRSGKRLSWLYAMKQE